MKDHLGGHQNKTWIDKGAFLWLKKRFSIQSVLDVGCGPGGMQGIVELSNTFYRGIDGDLDLEVPGRIIHDFCVGPAKIRSNYDLGWSVEFLEHVEEQYMANYMAAFQQCDYVVCTAAPPGYPGHHHVNCQDTLYWRRRFKEYGFRFLKKETKEMRGHSTMKSKKKRGDSFMVKTGMVYEKI